MYMCMCIYIYIVWLVYSVVWSVVISQLCDQYYISCLSMCITISICYHRLIIVLWLILCVSLLLVKIHRRGVQWKQGVVVYIMLKAVLLYNTTPIQCTPLRLHPPPTAPHFDKYPGAASAPPGTRRREAHMVILVMIIMIIMIVIVMVTV